MRIELATVIPGNAHANSHATAAVDWPLVSDQSEVARLGEHYDALLLYGSYARGDARQDSDIDLLAIDERSLPKPKLPPQFSLTVYNQKQICSMARRGSLFLLHLRHESKILKDVYNIFPPLWENWVAPDYARLRKGMHAAASVFAVASRTISASRLRRLALFVLRSAVYAACAERGRPAFAASSVAEVLNDMRLSDCFNSLARESDDTVMVKALTLLEAYVGKANTTEYPTLEAMAVSWYKRFPMASHIAVKILTADTEMAYTASPVDWIAA